jgi:hypothetical protein
MNIMSVEGYQAKIEYDAELDMFRGEILGLHGGADFYGRTPEELRAEFRQSLQVFLEVCREKGIDPSARVLPSNSAPDLDGSLRHSTQRSLPACQRKPAGSRPGRAASAGIPA